MSEISRNDVVADALLEIVEQIRSVEPMDASYSVKWPFLDPPIHLEVRVREVRDVG